jgi:hypothetical protein
MMDIQARYLVFHSALVLLAGLLVGVPYGRAAAMVGQRGHTLDKPLSNQLVFAGNMVGLGASLVGTLVLLYAAYVSLP